jgi:hypothetical protein
MRSPFKFLDPYELRDRDAFFGREAEVRELYNLVTKNRLTFVYGPSGTGKTSLVQCGLAAKFGGVDWLPVFVRRGANLNLSLWTHLAVALGGPLTAAHPAFADTSRPPGAVANERTGADLAQAVTTLYRRYLRPVYLIFDQFEELFILGASDDAAEREPFYEAIAELLDEDLPCRLLFILREDYFGHLNHFEKIVPELYGRKLRVEPMSRDNLRRVVTGSCAAYQIALEDPRRSPDAILDNMLPGKGAVHMPYVQVYLHMLYQEAVTRQHPGLADEAPWPHVVFDRAVIDAVGPITDVLGRFLKEQEAAIARQLAQRHADVPDDVVRQVLDVFVSEQGTKAPVFYDVGRDGIVRPHVQGRLDHLPPVLVSAALFELENSRLLRRSEDELELAHDSLAALIDQQRTAEQRQLAEVRRRLETGYREHVDSDGAYFFDRGQLARIEPFLPRLRLEPTWAAFLDQSRADVEREEHAEAARAHRELELAQAKLAVERRARLRQGVLTAVAVVVGIVSTLLWRESTAQRAIAVQENCNFKSEQLERLRLEKTRYEQEAQTFRKAGETLNEAAWRAEVVRIDSAMSGLTLEVDNCR